MNYVDKIAKMIGIESGMDFDQPEERRLLRLYALLWLHMGVAVSLSDVHDAWAVWRLETKPDHPCIKPFYDLDRDTQERDRKYMDAIIRAGKRVRANP